VRDLKERFGAFYELGALSRSIGVSQKVLEAALEEAGVPMVTVGRKRAVVRELADRALGLDRAEVALEIKRNADAMRRAECRTDGTRKTVAEFATGPVQPRQRQTQS
jgi:hypothetical protein